MRHRVEELRHIVGDAVHLAPRLLMQDRQRSQQRFDPLEPEVVHVVPRSSRRFEKQNAMDAKDAEEDWLFPKAVFAALAAFAFFLHCMTRNDDAARLF